MEGFKDFVVIALLLLLTGFMYVVGLAFSVVLLATPFLAIGLGIAGMIKIIGWAIG